MNEFAREVHEALQPVADWYGGGTEGSRSDIEILRDAVSDLQADRATVLQQRADLLKFGQHLPDCKPKPWENVYKCGFLQTVLRLFKYTRPEKRSENKRLKEACSAINQFLELDFPRMTPVQWAITVGNLKALLASVLKTNDVGDEDGP